MVDIGAVGGTIASWVGRLIKGGIYIVLLILLGAIIFAVVYYIKWYRQFNIKVRIKSKRGTGTDGKPIYKIINDKAGIITNRSNKTRYFRLKSERIDMPTPPFEVMQLQADGTNVIDILQESDEQYYYLLPGEIDKEYMIIDGQKVLVAKSNFRMAEGGDIIWNISRKEQNKKWFDTESLLMKLLPYAIPILMIIGVIFYTYIWMDKTPQIISAANEVAKALENAAIAIRDANVATVTGS